MEPNLKLKKMSREIININKNISIAYGNDHAIGKFLDIRDKRYAQSNKDEQGEGYLVEWCEMFKFAPNLIGITIDEFDNKERIIELCNKFCENDFKSKT